ncbi:pyridine nucleotide-disulfide oxidoreductase [Antricoccus suffuscus]|uniref:Pyridine nucleotide-disulfide oxidoreductase n=1 Tax=Antricoccus suffuscus TaxID=1629062 RepID=A0A2T0ZZY8_9ACTN|nr:NAD(P)-binding domain-containing protein [Antricoccus suffuscus]PRZ41807.1 pyridine nucleotide-disulfide oxidoreductase [Antricoccus suffuscus]
MPEQEVAVAVIGAGQSGLSAAYFLAKRGMRPWTDFVVLDHGTGPGGAWRERWPSLTLSTVNGVHDLPGMSMAEVVPVDSREVKASEAMTAYFSEYERRFALPVKRPVTVRRVSYAGEGGERRFQIATDGPTFLARGVINATGTWERPFIPHYPGIEKFRGRQLHTKDYRSACELAGQHVLVVGGGISAVQLLDEISQVTTTTWVTRREVIFTDEPFSPERGRQAVARVDDRVRRGLPPTSVVSVTGLAWTPALCAAQTRGALDRLPMFSEITDDGVRWADGSVQRVDVILWCTGFRSALDQLAPLHLRGEGGGIVMDGRLATRVAGEHRLHLVGYGPSASTIGANRGARAAVTELLRELPATTTAT